MERDQLPVSAAAQWIIPGGYGITDLYQDETFLHLLKSPECQIKLKDLRSGKIAHLSKKDSEYLKLILGSMSSYSAVTACMFIPTIQIEFSQGSASKSIEVCFSCQDIRFVRSDGPSIPCTRLNDQGFDVLKAICFNELGME